MLAHNVSAGRPPHGGHPHPPLKAEKGVPKFARRAGGAILFLIPMPVMKLATSQGHGSGEGMGNHGWTIMDGMKYRGGL